MRYHSSEISSDAVASPKAVPPSLNNTDVIAPSIKLFIEGIEVPFESISISQVYKQLPQASIQIPPHSGLMEIVRGYQPKVHIFYFDENYGGFRLLFWGLITSTSYAKSRNGSGNSYINFSCEHKNSLLSDIKLDFVGWGNAASESVLNPNSNDATSKPSSFNSETMILMALTGINGVASTQERLIANNITANQVPPVDKIHSEVSNLLPRWQGMPGVLVNLWNQIKLANLVNPKLGVLINKMYGPLVDEGISYFKRMSGHPLVEKQLQDTKEPFCHQKSKKEYNTLVPPFCRNYLASSIQQDIAIKNIQNMASFSGEFTTFETLSRNLLEYSKYDLITLASPAEIELDPSRFSVDLNKPGVEKVAIETVVKPELPFYYSPTCNVLLPRMYTSLSFTQDEKSMPTRLIALHQVMGAETSNFTKTTYIAPHSVRESLAFIGSQLNAGTDRAGFDLGQTRGYTFHTPGMYELGSGVKSQRIMLPWWISALSANKLSNKATNETIPSMSSDEYKELMTLTAAWRERYGYSIKTEGGVPTYKVNEQKWALNPNDPNNKSINNYERLMFTSLDYEYSTRVAGSRYGNIDCVFNPYIIPGYPMDVIDDNPNNPSFHGFCVSVTHTITSRSISTSVSMAAAMTYAELSNYQPPPAYPFLQSVLKMINSEVDESLLKTKEFGNAEPFTNPSTTLLQNPKAKQAADEFYKQVLGVGAVSPEDLIHFQSGRPFPLFREQGVLIPKILSNTAPQTFSKVARQQDDYYSTVGNLRLVSRPIESLESIESKYYYKFISYDPKMYNNTFVNYVNPALTTQRFLEPGSSLFLDYQEIQEFLKDI